MKKLLIIAVIVMLISAGIAAADTATTPPAAPSLLNNLESSQVGATFSFVKEGNTVTYTRTDNGWVSGNSQPINSQALAQIPPPAALYNLENPKAPAPAAPPTGPSPESRTFEEQRAEMAQTPPAGPSPESRTFEEQRAEMAQTLPAQPETTTAKKEQPPVKPPSDTPPAETEKKTAEQAKKNIDDARKEWATARKELETATKARDEAFTAREELAEYNPYDEEEKKAFDAAQKKLDEAENKLDKAKKDEQNARTAFNDAQWTFTGIVSNIVTAYRRYAGLAGISSLLFDKKFLENWKNSVNDAFCKTIVLGGINCWASKICGQYSDITPSKEGVLFGSPVGGAPPAVAHIEGMRSLPIDTPNGTAWIYTVTFGITNPEKDNGMAYNIVFAGPKKTAGWWEAQPVLGGGASTAATGASALMKLSASDYNEVCLKMSPGLTSFDGKKVSSLCNSIAQYTGGATAPYPVAAGNATAVKEGAATAPSGAAPQAPPGANV